MLKLSVKTVRTMEPHKVTYDNFYLSFFYVRSNGKYGPWIAICQPIFLKIKLIIAFKMLKSYANFG